MRQSYIETNTGKAKAMTILQRLYRAIRETSTLSKEDARFAALRLYELQMAESTLEISQKHNPKKG